MENSIITADFGGGKYAQTRPLWQWDRGIVLQFTGVELPSPFEVHFAATDSDKAKPVVGENSAVIIPASALQTAGTLNAYIYLHDTEDDGETVYHAVIPVRQRQEPEDYDPTPEQESIVAELITLLQDATDDAEHYADEAAEKAQSIIDKMGGLSFEVDPDTNGIRLTYTVSDE